MILYLPAALFAVSLLAAYGTVGRQRQAATIGALLAAAWSMALLVDPSLTAWAIGPIVATLLLPRHGARARSSFEGLTRRVTTIVGALLVGVILASRLPLGENPVLLTTCIAPSDTGRDDAVADDVSHSASREDASDLAADAARRRSR